jgi:hypothetical protein
MQTSFQHLWLVGSTGQSLQIKFDVFCWLDSGHFSGLTLLSASNCFSRPNFFSSLDFRGHVAGGMGVDACGNRGLILRYLKVGSGD